MKRAVDEGSDLSAAVRSFDAGPFLYLSNAAELMPGNASRTYPNWSASSPGRTAPLRRAGSLRTAARSRATAGTGSAG